MKQYYMVEMDGVEDWCKTIASLEPLYKEDHVVVPEEDFFKVTVEKKRVNALNALTNGHVDEIICKIDVSDYLAQQEALAQNAMIERAMHRKMDEMKNLDTLKKFADKDPEFAELFNIYKNNLAVNSVDWTGAVKEDKSSNLF